MPKIAILGDIFVDIFTSKISKFPQWNEVVETNEIKFLIGGSGCNTARYLGGLGVHTRLYSALGEDNLSNLAFRELQSENYIREIDSIVKSPNTLAPTVVIVNGEKKNAYIANMDALKKFSIDQIDISQLLEYDHLHFAGYFIFQALHTTEFLEFIKELKRNGLTISIDFQIDPKNTWTGENGHLAKLLPLVDVAMPLSHTALHITATDSVEDAIGKLGKIMPNGLIIIKNSEECEAWFSVPMGTGQTPDKGITNAASFKGGLVVDATGGGASFNAGFLCKWVQDKNNRTDDFMDWDRAMEAVEFGCATAKFCFERMGAFVKGVNMEMVEELVNRL